MNDDLDILTPKSTQALLDLLSHRPQKKWGQNFLIDANIVRKSLEFAELKSGEKVVEVGPGLGTLTRALLRNNTQVYAVERDPVLAQFLRDNTCPLFEDTLHLLEGDAMNSPRGLLPDVKDGDFKIVANLPYAIATPWLELILKGPLPSRMVMMLQKEAADRYLAKPGSKSYGAITIFIEATYERSDAHKVSKQCFYPVPKVDSTLLCLSLKQDPYVFKTETKKIIREFFTQRRKQIGGLMKRQEKDLMSWVDTLKALGLSEKSRPEEIPLEGWIKLDECY